MDEVVCAIGHKLVLYAFHIMRGDPTPNRDGEAFFKQARRECMSSDSERADSSHPRRRSSCTARCPSPRHQAAQRH